MPNNIAKRGLTDREILQLCLELEKGRCRSACSTMLETTHKELRDIYKACMETASENHYEIFNIMNQKGWYKTELASIEQIDKVQEYMQNNLHPDNQF
ncbi:MAG TPA: spore coat protein [Niallia sp.]|nr:spore coat protein [Niallia sp.]